MCLSLAPSQNKMPTGSAAAGMTPSTGAKHQQPPPSLRCLLLARSLPRTPSTASAAARLGSARHRAAALPAPPQLERLPPPGRAAPRTAESPRRGCLTPTPSAEFLFLPFFVVVVFPVWCAKRDRSLRSAQACAQEGSQRLVKK